MFENVCLLVSFFTRYASFVYINKLGKSQGVIKRLQVILFNGTSFVHQILCSLSRYALPHLSSDHGWFSLSKMATGCKVLLNLSSRCIS